MKAKKYSYFGVCLYLRGKEHLNHRMGSFRSRKANDGKTAYARFLWGLLTLAGIIGLEFRRHLLTTDKRSMVSLAFSDWFNPKPAILGWPSGHPPFFSPKEVTA